MSFKDNKEYNWPFHSDHKYAIRNFKVKRKYDQHVHFHDFMNHTYKQSYTNESSQNEISTTTKSVDSAHYETFSQCQPRKRIQNCLT